MQLSSKVAGFYYKLGRGVAIVSYVVLVFFYTCFIIARLFFDLELDDVSYSEIDRDFLLFIVIFTPALYVGRFFLTTSTAFAHKGRLIIDGKHIDLRSVSKVVEVCYFGFVLCRIVTPKGAYQFFPKGYISLRVFWYSKAKHVHPLIRELNQLVISKNRGLQ